MFCCESVKSGLYWLCDAIIESVKQLDVHGLFDSVCAWLIKCLCALLD